MTGLDEIQQLMADLYLDRDKSRGLDRTVLWFVSEVGELAEIIAKKRANKNYNSMLTDELADCLAWICSIANILNINLKQALFTKYPNKCPRCGKNPCDCDF